MFIKFINSNDWERKKNAAPEKSEYADSIGVKFCKRYVEKMNSFDISRKIIYAHFFFNILAKKC